MSGCLTYIYNLSCSVCGDKFTGAPWHTHCPRCWQKITRFYKEKRIAYGKKKELKELQCGRCNGLFVQDYRNLIVCDQCFEERECEIPEEPDMSGADAPGDEGNR